MTLEQYRDSLPAADLLHLGADLLHLGADDRHVDLDKRHVAIRAGTTWIIYQRCPDGWLHQVDRWVGARRSIFGRMEALGIEASLEAEAQLDGMHEGTGFRQDEPEELDDASSHVDKSAPQPE